MTSHESTLYLVSVDNMLIKNKVSVDNIILPFFGPCTEEGAFGDVCTMQSLRFWLLLDLTLQLKCISCPVLCLGAWLEMQRQKSVTDQRY